LCEEETAERELEDEEYSKYVQLTRGAQIMEKKIQGTKK
jgi:hypothetical protein